MGQHSLMRPRMKSDRFNIPGACWGDRRGGRRYRTSVVSRQTSANISFGAGLLSGAAIAFRLFIIGCARRLAIDGSVASLFDTALHTPSRTSSSFFRSRTKSSPPPPPPLARLLFACCCLATTIPSYNCRTESPSESHRSQISRMATADAAAHRGIDNPWARYGNSGRRYAGCIPSQLAYLPTVLHAVARSNGTSGSWGTSPITNGRTSVSSGGT
mmetsp:Transcript_17090/g.40971  ORF Transcript_17090/g.40971 Transcript_17090/m.40971 type:complete len:215 (+) Transcript_17090:190-834(+)